MTEIKIYRGNQIGGCITEIQTESTRILIDFGEELPGSGNEETFAFPWEERKVDAVFFTHYHGDHIGRFWQVPKDIPLYMSELSWDVLVNINEYLKENLPRLANRRGEAEAARLRQEAKKHGEILDILKESGAHRGEKRIHIFRSHEGKRIEIGNISVTPFWVDHSAADACMFLIETPDKRILHTGDFRGHGSQGENGRALWETGEGLKPIDVLITEGTMMSRQNERPYAEADLRKDADRLFAEHRHVFLILSSTNLDSISTFYQAAKEKHLSMYGYNPYVEHQIKTLGEYADTHWDGAKMEDVKQIRPWDHSQLAKMKKAGFVAIIKANEQGEQLVREFQDCKPVVVYSMWGGYYKRKLDIALCNFVDACKEKNIPVYPLTDSSYGPMHTSGHADPELIAKLIRAADPRELFPIHTEDARAFLQLDIPQNLKTELKKRLAEEQMVTREEAIAKGYSEKMDHRYLSDDALKKFLPEGSHRFFIELVNKYPKELAFCFRGNSSNQATIYYRNHIVFRVLSRGNVQFDFGHVRYMKEADRLKKTLGDFGFEFKENQEKGIVSMSAEAAAKMTLEDLDRLFHYYIKPMIDTFSDKKGLTEKAVQHHLFLHQGCKKLKDGYFIYDLEFSQPYAEALDCKNQPDMMAIRFDGGGKPERLVFVEVKSKAMALYGESGLEKHIDGMENYPDWLLPIRRRDAYCILNQYIRLGLLEAPPRSLVEAEFMELHKESLLIFTGDAVDELKNPHETGGISWETFLERTGYQLLEKGVIPSISLDGKMAAYQKLF